MFPCRQQRQSCLQFGRSYACPTSAGYIMNASLRWTHSQATVTGSSLYNASQHSSLVCIHLWQHYSPPPTVWLNRQMSTTCSIHAVPWHLLHRSFWSMTMRRLRRLGLASGSVWSMVMFQIKMSRPFCYKHFSVLLRPNLAYIVRPYRIDTH